MGPRVQLVWAVLAILVGLPLRFIWPGGPVAVVGVTLAIFGVIMLLQSVFTIARAGDERSDY